MDFELTGVEGQPAADEPERAMARRCWAWQALHRQRDVRVLRASGTHGTMWMGPLRPAAGVLRTRAAVLLCAVHPTVAGAAATSRQRARLVRHC